MIARIRKGNDFHVAWQIKRGGVAENLENVTDIKLERTIYGVTTEHTLFTVSGDTITAEIPAEVQTHNGQYKLTLSYELVDTGMSDDDRKCKVAIYAFAIVDPLGPADDLLTVDVASDVSIGFKGDKGLSAYQVWLEDGNVGTEDDYFDYLRQPATDAAASVSELEGTVSDNEALRVTAEQGRVDAELLRVGAESARSDAEGIRDSAEDDRIAAEGIRNTNETGRINAESDRVDAEDLRDQAEVAREEAEGLRQDNETNRVDAEALRASAEIEREETIQEAVAATTAANDAATLANTKAGLADTARTELTTAVNNKLGEADDKIEEMDTTLSAYDGRVTQVESDISQLAGELNQNSNLETTSKNVVGAINEVNRIVSIHHADNKAVRRWNNTLSTPIGDAVGDLDFLRELPRILGLGCYLVEDDLTKKKLYRDNHNYYEDGSPALLDGSEGQYMFCWGAFYFTTWEEGDYTYEAISLQPIIGKKSYYIPAGGYSAIGHGVIDRTDLTLCSVVNSDPRYRGGGNAVLTGTLAGENDPQTTMLGMPATVYGIQTAQDYARKRGDNWNACWFVSRSAIEILIRIVYGNRHTQDTVNVAKDANGLYQGGFGSGVTAMPDWGGYNGSYPVIPTSAGVEFGDLCGSFVYNVPKADGSVYYAAPVPSFFGLKNFFGHLWFGVAGLTINATEAVTEAYVMPSMFGGWNYASLAGMLKAAESAKANGYIKRLSMNLLCALPTEVGASASTDFADYFYENTAGGSYGLRARWGGGHATHGASAGAFYTYSNSAASAANASRSVPLCFFEEDPIVEL